MTFKTQLSHRFESVGNVFARMRVVAGPAVIVLKWFMYNAVFKIKPHVAVTAQAELPHGIIQEILVRRRMRSVTGYALPFIHRRMYICLEEFILLFFMTGIT